MQELNVESGLLLEETDSGRLTAAFSDEVGASEGGEEVWKRNGDWQRKELKSLHEAFGSPEAVGHSQAATSLRKTLPRM